MEEQKNCPIVVADTFIKQKSVITVDGQVIRNTPEDPNAVEKYWASKRK